MMNTIDTEMCNILIAELKKWRLRPKTCPRVLVLSGTGENAFCAGGDVVSLYKAEKKVPGYTITLRHFESRQYLLDFTLS